MRVIKDMDPAIELEPIANALIKGHVVKGITECADNNPDLFCVTREQRSTRDLVDAITAQLFPFKDNDLHFNYTSWTKQWD